MVSDAQVSEHRQRAAREVAAAQEARAGAEADAADRARRLAGAGQADPLLSEAQVRQAMADAHSGRTAWAQAGLPEGDGDGD